jgi:Ca-activated chloride channel family protein
MRPVSNVGLIALAGVTLAVGSVVAQSTGQESMVNITPRPRNPAGNAETGPRANIRVDTTLVPIPVSVTDPLRRFVTGLDKEDFKVYEDKVEQEISHLSNEDVPLSVGIVFDTSGSMGAKLSSSRQAVGQFIKTANPEDEFFLVEFNDRPNIAVGFTSSPEDIQSRLTFTRSKGQTALLDSVYMAMSQMKKAHNPRRAILIISDGGDNSSRYTERELKNAVRESDVQIYVIGIYEPGDQRYRTPEEEHGPDLLGALAKETGGRAFEVNNLADLPDVAAKIGMELRNEYVLYYSPHNLERDGKYRRVQVKVIKKAGLPPLTPTFRTGYYAPAQ